MPTTSFTIECPGGHALAAKLDEPEGQPTAYAVFAHCFTCSKDTTAAFGVARNLAQQGIATLRIDFTGLGESEGEFEDSTFSANIADLRAACKWLIDHRDAPAMLIGHSLGGAAVLALASAGGDELARVRAVATIGAPADPAHVAHLLGHQREAIERDGSAPVTIGGRPFRVAAEFFKDLERQDPQSAIANLGKALMIFHSPVDTVVGIENAATIYGWAKHPKSYVSLDKADHLLTNRADAAMVAGILAAWAQRVLAD